MCKTTGASDAGATAAGRNPVFFAADAFRPVDFSFARGSVVERSIVADPTGVPASGDDSVDVAEDDASAFVVGASAFVVGASATVVELSTRAVELSVTLAVALEEEWSVVVSEERTPGETADAAVPSDTADCPEATTSVASEALFVVMRVVGLRATVFFTVACVAAETPAVGAFAAGFLATGAFATGAFSAAAFPAAAFAAGFFVAGVLVPGVLDAGGTFAVVAIAGVDFAGGASVFDGCGIPSLVSSASETATGSATGSATGPAFDAAAADGLRTAGFFTEGAVAAAD